MEPEFPRTCTLEEYFRLAHESVEKLEFRGGVGFPTRGQVVAMPGTTEFHALIAANVGGELWSRLKGSSCRYYPADFRVGVRSYPTYTYTDGHVICGPTVLDGRDPAGRTAANPLLVVEVLSPATEGYDRGKKFVRYMAFESLQEYVLVSQDKPRVETFFRQPDGTWLFSHTTGLDAVARLRSIDVDLPLSEVYLNVIFPPSAEGAGGEVSPPADRQ